MDYTFLNARLIDQAPSGKIWAEEIFGADYIHVIGYNRLDNIVVWNDILNKGDITIGEAYRSLAPIDFIGYVRSENFRKITGTPRLGFTSMYSIYNNIDLTLGQKGIALVLDIPMRNLMTGPGSNTFVNRMMSLINDESLMQRPLYLNMGSSAATLDGIKILMEESVDEATRYNGVVTSRITNALNNDMYRNSFTKRSGGLEVYAPWSMNKFVGSSDTSMITPLGYNMKGARQYVSPYVSNAEIYGIQYPLFVLNDYLLPSMDNVITDRFILSTQPGFFGYETFTLGRYDNILSRNGYRGYYGGTYTIKSGNTQISSLKPTRGNYRVLQTMNFMDMFYISEAKPTSTIKMGDQSTKCIYDMMVNDERILVNGISYSASEFFLRWLVDDEDIASYINRDGSGVWMGMYKEYSEVGYDKIWSKGANQKNKTKSNGNWYINSGGKRTDTNFDITGKAEAIELTGYLRNFIFVHDRKGMATLETVNGQFKRVNWKNTEQATLGKYEYLIVEKYGFGSLEHKIFLQDYKHIGLSSAWGLQLSQKSCEIMYNLAHLKLNLSTFLLLFKIGWLKIHF